MYQGRMQDFPLGGGAWDICTKSRIDRAASTGGLGERGCNFGHSKRLEISFSATNNVRKVAATRKDVVVLSRYTYILHKCKCTYILHKCKCILKQKNHNTHISQCK